MKRSIPGKAYTMKLSERLIKITEYIKDAAKNITSNDARVSHIEPSSDSTGAPVLI